MKITKLFRQPHYWLLLLVATLAAAQATFVLYPDKSEAAGDRAAVLPGLESGG